MSTSWHAYGFTVGLPHMVPGAKLSEVEFLKLLLMYQWQSIAQLVGRSPGEIANEFEERLYASVIACELDLAGRHSLESLGEDTRIEVRNHIASYAQRFVEGLFAFDDGPVSDDLLGAIKTKRDLEGLGLPWAHIANAFVTRAAGNTGLKVFKPVGLEQGGAAELAEVPLGMSEQREVLHSGAIPALADDPGEGRPLLPDRPGPIRYRIVPESDLNGAGLVYFARFVAMMSYAERRFLMERFEGPTSAPFVACLSTERRRIYYFGNANPEDSVELSVSAQLLPASGGSAPARYRTPLKLEFRADFHRGSDKVLIASSLVRKALNVPADDRSVLAEAERFLRQHG